MSSPYLPVGSIYAKLKIVSDILAMYCHDTGILNSIELAIRKAERFQELSFGYGSRQGPRIMSDP